MDNPELTVAGKAKSEDTAGLSALVDQYQDKLFNTVLRLIGNPEDALDIVQETFLKAHRSLRRFKGESKVYTWLYRIAVNTALSFRRSAATQFSRSSVSLDNGYRNGDSDPKRDVPDEKFEASAAVQKKEVQQRVTEAIAKLEPDLRSVVVLRDIEGLNYEDIAGILEVPKGTVKSRLHRGRLELREELKDFL